MTAVKKNSFEVDKRLRGLARSLTNNLKLQVNFHASGPMTDGKVINLPTIKPDMTKQEFDAFAGHVEHEVGHLLFTDFEMMLHKQNDPRLRDIALKYSGNYTDRLVHYLWNWLEDVRIETELTKKLPGAEYFAVQGCEVITERTLKNPEFCPDTSSVSKGIDYAMAYLYCMHFPSSKAKLKTHPLFLEYAKNPYFNDFRMAAEPIMARAKTATSDETLDLLKELLRRFSRIMNTINDEEEKNGKRQPNSSNEAIQILVDPQTFEKLKQQQKNSPPQPNNPNAQQIQVICDPNLEPSDEDDEDDEDEDEDCSDDSDSQSSQAPGNDSQSSQAPGNDSQSSQAPGNDSQSSQKPSSQKGQDDPEADSFEGANGEFGGDDEELDDKDEENEDQESDFEGASEESEEDEGDSLKKGSGTSADNKDEEDYEDEEDNDSGSDTETDNDDGEDTESTDGEDSDSEDVSDLVDPTYGDGADPDNFDDNADEPTQSPGGGSGGRQQDSATDSDGYEESEETTEEEQEGLDDLANEAVDQMGTEMKNSVETERQNFIEENSTQGVKTEYDLGDKKGGGFITAKVEIMPKLVKEQAKAEARKFKKFFMRSFLSFKNKLRRRNLYEGVLDNKTAPRFLTHGKINIFKQEKKFHRINTAVHLTIDVSSSMAENFLYRSARKVAFAIDDAIKSTNVKFSVSMFNDSYQMLKKENDKLNDTILTRLTYGGLTDLAKAVLTSAKYLATKQQERKIIIAITDGGVDSNTIQVDNIVTAHGFEVYYIIVANSQNMANYMRDSCPIEKTRAVAFGGDFSAEFMKTFQNLLTEGHV
jgi:hypothetical protein